MFAIQNRVNFVTFLKTPFLLKMKNKTRTGTKLKLCLCLIFGMFGGVWGQARELGLKMALLIQNMEPLLVEVPIIVRRGPPPQVRAL